jgi:hypothetical protein
MTNNLFNPQQSSSRSDLYNAVMKVVRSHLELNGNKQSNYQKKNNIIPQSNQNKMKSDISLPKPKIIHSVKPITAPKPVTKIRPLKKSWDPNHTTIAWKG